MMMMMVLLLQLFKIRPQSLEELVLVPMMILEFSNSSSVKLELTITTSLGAELSFMDISAVVSPSCYFFLVFNHDLIRGSYLATYFVLEFDDKCFR